MKSLSKEEAVKLIGKEIYWEAYGYETEGYETVYSGIAKILSVSDSKRGVLKCEIIEGDDLNFALLDVDDVICFSDAGRGVTFSEMKYQVVVKNSQYNEDQEEINSYYNGSLIRTEEGVIEVRNNHDFNYDTIEDAEKAIKEYHNVLAYRFKECKVIRSKSFSLMDFIAVYSINGKRSLVYFKANDIEDAMMFCHNNMPKGILIRIDKNVGDDSGEGVKLIEFNN